MWAPQAGSQKIFVSCPIDEALFEGTRGSAKTNGLLLDFAQFCGRGYGQHWRGILFRQTYPQLADVVAKTKQWFLPHFAGVSFNAGDFTWKWKTGEELLLRHMRHPDDYWNYHGHEYPWIGWEELTNWTTLECYEAMKSCSRSSHPGMPRRYRSTCNPYGAGHNAVKSYFIDIGPPGTIYTDPITGLKRVRIHGDIEENRILMAADPQYIKKLDAIQNEHKRKAWRRGDWNIVAGGMFDAYWDEDVHVLPVFKIPAGWRIDRSFDWGKTKPFSVGWWAVSNGENVTYRDGTARSFPPGTIIRIGEWYGWNGKANEGLNLLSSEIARGILERETLMGIAGRVEPGPADTYIWETVEGGSMADTMGIIGVNWEPAVKNAGSRVLGWERLSEMMQASVVNEGAGFYVMNNCTQFIRTVPVLPRDEKNPDDVNTDAEDHIADETRYRVLHVPRVATMRSM